MPRHYSAADFVAWYNGHPDFADRSFDLTHEGAVIIGNGNVAIDVARVPHPHGLLVIATKATVVADPMAELGTLNVGMGTTNPAAPAVGLTGRS